MKRKAYKCTTKESFQITREEDKRRKEQEYKKNQKTIHKMAISTYLTKITLNVNGLNVPNKRHRG